MRQNLIIAALILASVFPPAGAATVPGGARAAQAHDYKISGDAGRLWVNTGIDLKPGVLVSLGASGEVYYGDFAGTQGPEGTPKFNDSRGFPAETAYRYGLVARVTGSSSNPEDDLREDYAYGESREFCTRSGGRLWLTANDDDPKDNKGAYLVTVKLSACGEAPAARPTPDPGRGVFRVRIAGFRVRRVVHDGLLDAGDDAYVMWDAAEFDRDGRLVRDHMSGQSLVYGDAGRRRVQVQAGTRGARGGLKSGDEVAPLSSAASPDRFPLLVGDFELVDGANAFVLCPTVWVAEDGQGDYPADYRRRLQRRARFLSHDVRESLERNRARFHWVTSLTRAPDDWFSMLLYKGALGGDRPVGVSSLQALSRRGPLDQNISDWDFVPHTFLLTYRSVTDLIREAGGGSGQSWAPFEAVYRDSGPTGDYQIMMTVERIR